MKYKIKNTIKITAVLLSCYLIISAIPVSVAANEPALITSFEGNLADWGADDAGYNCQPNKVTTWSIEGDYSAEFPPDTSCDPYGTIYDRSISDITQDGSSVSVYFYYPSSQSGYESIEIRDGPDDNIIGAIQFENGNLIIPSFGPDTGVNIQQNQAYKVEFKNIDFTNQELTYVVIEVGNGEVYNSTKSFKNTANEINEVSVYTDSGGGNLHLDYIAKNGQTPPGDYEFNVEKTNMINGETIKINSTLDNKNVNNNANISHNASGNYFDTYTQDNQTYLTALNPIPTGKYEITSEYTNPETGREYKDSKIISVHNTQLDIQLEKHYTKHDKTYNYSVYYNDTQLANNEYNITTSNNLVEIDKNNETFHTHENKTGQVWVDVTYTTEEGVEKADTTYINVEQEKFYISTPKTVINNSEDMKYDVIFSGNVINDSSNLDIYSLDKSLATVDSNNYQIIANQTNEGFVTIQAKYDSLSSGTYTDNKSIYINKDNKTGKFEFLIDKPGLRYGNNATIIALYNNTDVTQESNFSVNKSNYINIDKEANEIIGLDNKGMINITAKYENNTITYEDYEHLFVENRELELSSNKYYLNGSEKIGYDVILGSNSLESEDINITVNKSDYINLYEDSKKIEGLENNTGYVKVTSSYNQYEINYKDSKNYFVDNRKLYIILQQKYLEHGDTQFIYVKYENEDVTNSENITLKFSQNLLNFDKENGTITAINNKEKDGEITITAEYMNQLGYNYTANTLITIDTKYLSIRATDYLDYNRTDEYTIKYGNDVVTKNASINSSDTNLLTINKTSSLLISTSNKSKEGFVTIQANYTDKYGYTKNATHEIFVGADSTDNIGVLPPYMKLFVILGNGEIQALLFIITAGMGGTLLVNPYAGILACVLGVAIGFIGGAFGLGFLTITIIGAIFMVMNTDIRFTNTEM